MSKHSDSPDVQVSTPKSNSTQSEEMADHSISMPKLRAGNLSRNSSATTHIANNHHQFPTDKSLASIASMRDLPENTPTRPARDRETSMMRGRGQSRSSSVPNMAYLSTNQGREDHSRTSPTSVEGAANLNKSTRHNNSSVKHLTCFWWKEKGTCRFSDDECLYAHRDTGHYTDPPRQLVPGEPALAGRKLDRAMRNLAIAAHRSSSSLSTMAGSRHTSRPSTPIFTTDPGFGPSMNFSSPLAAPSTISTSFNPDADLARLNSDNHFLRTLVDQNGKEKAVMINTIETLQADNKCMKGELDGLRNAQEQLLAEREGLHNRIKQLEDEKSQGYAQNRSVGNPFGTIGRARVNTETRYIGGLLAED